ncbi:MAG TPA: phage tail protein [Gemmatimonadales bacterium]
MTRPVDVSFVVAAAILGLTGFVRPAVGQVPDPATTPRLAVPARGVAAPLPGQPTTAPTAAAPAAAAPAAAAPAEPAPVSAAPPPSGVTQVPPAAAPPATASSSQAATADKRSYAAGKFGLVLEGTQLGWLKSVEGGTASSEVVVEKVGPDRISAKHIAGVKYKDISFETDLQSKQLIDWIAASWKGNPARKSGSVQAMDYDNKPVSELEFFNALVTETTMPALDGAGKDPLHITVNLSPEYTRAKAGSGAKVSGSPSNQTQKKWLPSNFRFEMAGLDASRVNKIDAFTVKQVVAENPVGEARDYQKEPSAVEFPNLRITLPASYASTWVNWHDDFVVKGNSGTAQERNGAIVYLDPSRKVELGRVNLMNCGIFALDRLKTEANSESIVRMVADLYCERMELVPGSASSLN